MPRFQAQSDMKIVNAFQSWELSAMEEKVLYPSRVRAILLTLVCLFVCVIAPGFMRVICGLGACVFASSLVSNSAWLKLNADGFVVKNLFREESYKWSDIESFVLITKRYLGVIPIYRYVGFRFSESYRKRGIIRKASLALVGFDRNLAENYGLKAKVLAQLLEKLSDPRGCDVAGGRTFRSAATAAPNQVLLNGQVVTLDESRESA